MLLLSRTIQYISQRFPCKVLQVTIAYWKYYSLSRKIKLSNGEERERNLDIFQASEGRGEKIQTPNSNLTPDYEQLDHDPINSSTLPYIRAHSTPVKPDLPPPLLFFYDKYLLRIVKFVCDYSTFPGRVRAARRAAWVTAAWARAATVPGACYPAAGCDVTRGPGLGLDESAPSVSVTRDCRLASRGRVSRELAPLGNARSRSPSSEPRTSPPSSVCVRLCVNAPECTCVRVLPTRRIEDKRRASVLPYRRAF